MSTLSVFARRYPAILRVSCPHRPVQLRARFILLVGMIALWTTSTSALAQCDVNLVDHNRFASCMSGPATQGCTGPCGGLYDSDRDNDLDLFDHADFQRRFGTLSAFFDWSMPPRFGFDEDGDDMRDYFVTPESISPASWHVDFNACRGCDSELSYQWSIDGIPVDTVTACNGFSFDFPDEGNHLVELEVEDSFGSTARVSQSVTVQDLLIVSIGDSMASGEGNPDIPVAIGAYEVYEDAFAALESAQSAFDNAVEALRAAEKAREAAATTWSNLQDRISTARGALSNYGSALTSWGLACSTCSCSNPCNCAWWEVCLFPASCCSATRTKNTRWIQLGNALAALGVGLTTDLVALANTLTSLWNAGQAAWDDATEAVTQARNALNTAQIFLNTAVNDLSAAEAALVPHWQHLDCHRSALSNPALAALAAEQADNHTSVTFVHVACSGASVLSGLVLPQTETQEGDGQSVAQLNEVAMLVGGREIDALLISIGANDIFFSDIVKGCVRDNQCHMATASLDPSIGPMQETLCSLQPTFRAGACAQFFDEALSDGPVSLELFNNKIGLLPGYFQTLATSIQELLPGVSPDRIFLTEYPNLTEDQDSVSCDFNGIDFITSIIGLSGEEMDWFRDIVTRELNQNVLDAAELYGWNFVGGVFDDFETHGYCSDEHWVVRLQESLLLQGNASGMIHPNDPGHVATAALIMEALMDACIVNGTRPAAK